MSEQPKVYGLGAYLADVDEQAKLRNLTFADRLQQLRDEDDAREAAREAERVAAESNVIQFRPRA